MFNLNFNFDGVKRILAIILSMLLATLPTVTWATDQAPPSFLSSENSAPVEVVMTEINGHRVAAVMAAIPPEQELQVFKNSVDADQNLIVAGQSAEDPLVEAALGSRQHVMGTIVLDKLENSVAVRLAKNPGNIKQRALARFKQIDRFLEVHHWGIFFSIVYCDIVGSAAAQISSSTAMGMAVFIPQLIWAGFTISSSHAWEHSIDYAGAKVKNAFIDGMSLVGRDVGTVGQAHAANLGRMGMMILPSLAGTVIMQAATAQWAGVVSTVIMSATTTYGVWDPTVFRYVRLGKFTRAKLIGYYGLQYIGGAIAESLMYNNWNSATYVLTANLVAGSAFMFFPKQIESTLQKTPGVIRLTRAQLKGSLRRQISRGKDCLSALSRPVPLGVPSRSAYADTW